MRQQGDSLDPKLDIVFWMLFGAEGNRDLLISLLNAVLQPADAIVSVEVLRAEVDKSSVDDKGIALDVRARFAGGQQADVEMQSQRRPAVRERGLYYWSRLYGGQLTRGAPYTDLRRCFVVIITNFNELSTARFHSTFGLRELKTGERLTDHLELHLVELPKLREAMERNEEPDLLAWGRFLAANTDEEREAVAATNPVLRRAQDALERLSADPEARTRAEMREMALISYDLDLTRARRDAEAEGRALGLAEGKAEGLAEGKAEGLAEGKAEGLAEGKAEGLAEGKAEGLAEGKAEGLAEGKAEGLAEGKAEGLAEGKAEGLAEGKAEGLAEGKAEGLAEGRRRGKATLLEKLLELRFGPLPAEIRRRLADANEARLDEWTFRVVSATTLSDVLGGEPAPR